jgi:Fe-S cluster assembly ATP-binding protein
MYNRKSMGLIITHTGHILDYVSARTGYVMLNGRIGCAGDPREILTTIRQKGYEECVKCIIGR